MDSSVPLNGDYIGLTIKPFGDKTYTWNATTQLWEDAGSPIFEHPLSRPEANFLDALAPPDGTGLANGTLWRVYQLPFGSFTPEQPKMEVKFSGVKLDAESATLQARGGYIFGDSPTGSPPVVSVVDPATIEPRIYSFSKSSNAKEGETATGANFPVEYTLSVNIDPDVAINGLVIEDILPAEFQFLSYTLPSLSGVTIMPNVPTALTDGTGGDSSGTVDLADVDFDDPANDAAEKKLRFTIDAAANAAGQTIDIKYKIYVPETYDGNRTEIADQILNEDSGNDKISTNTASANAGGTATYALNDLLNANTDTAFSPLTKKFENKTVDLEDQSIAIQKGISGTVIPGATLTYTLEFQISDYFNFGDIFIEDVFSDGQRLILDDPALKPQLIIDLDGTAIDGNDKGTYTFDTTGIDNPNWFSSSASSGGSVASGDNFEYKLRSRFRPETEQEAGTDTTPATTATNIFTDSGNTDGSTRLKFDISQLLKDKRTGSSGVLGNLLSADERNKITGRVVYHTEVQQNYTDLHRVTGFTGDRSVDAGDIIYNDAYIDGAVIDRATDPATIPDFDAFLGTLPREDDDTTASGSVPLLPKPVKRVYAVNGVAIEADADQKGFSITEEPTKLKRVKVGDLVTYRITVEGIQAPDAEDFTITDYLPLPVYDVEADTDALNDPIQLYSSLTAAGKLVPDVNTISFGELHDLLGPTQSSSPVLEDDLQRQNVTIDPDNNSFTVNFGKFNSLNENPNRTYTFDILFTFEVQDKPFDDRLFLTNQARLSYDNTETSPLSYDNTETSPNIQDTIVRIETAQPVPIVTKKTADPDSKNGIPVVDAEDLVEFEVKVENVGANSIFDLTIADKLPAGFEIPVDALGDVDWAALGFSVTTQAGTLNEKKIAFTTAGDDSDQGSPLVDALGNRVGTDSTQTAKDVVEAFFTQTAVPGSGKGIRLVDDVTNSDEFDRGAIDPGRTTQKTTTNVTDGSNELIIRYKLRVTDTALAGADYQNGAEIKRYAAIDGGENYIATVTDPDNRPRVNEGGDDLKPDFDAEITVLIENPTIIKNIASTSINTTNNNNTEATIGETVT
ncbi:MAG: hypothetical protein EAZ61_06145, partial [Oscillatoriales cyanobacterium]